MERKLWPSKEDIDGTKEPVNDNIMMNSMKEDNIKFILFSASSESDDAPECEYEIPSFEEGSSDSDGSSSDTPTSEFSDEEQEQGDMDEEQEDTLKESLSELDDSESEYEPLSDGEKASKKRNKKSIGGSAQKKQKSEANKSGLSTDGKNPVLQKRLLKTGTVYAAEFSNRSGRDLINCAKKRTNVAPIVDDVQHPHKRRHPLRLRHPTPGPPEGRSKALRPGIRSGMPAHGGAPSRDLRAGCAHAPVSFQRNIHYVTNPQIRFGQNPEARGGARKHYFSEDNTGWDKKVKSSGNEQDSRSLCSLGYPTNALRRRASHVSVQHAAGRRRRVRQWRTDHRLLRRRSLCWQRSIDLRRLWQWRMWIRRSPLCGEDAWTTRKDGIERFFT
eukprot:763488_1